MVAVLTRDAKQILYAVSICLFVSVIYCQYHIINQAYSRSLMKDLTSKIPYLNPETSLFSVALLIPTTMDLLPYVNFHILLWASDIAVPVSVTTGEESVLSSYLQVALFPSRVSVSVYTSPDSSFPVNKMRNDAVAKMTCTHFISLRPLQIPSKSLFESVYSLPCELLSNPKVVYIIPEFELSFVSIPCNTWYSCSQQDFSFSQLTKAEIKFCSTWGSCVSKGSTPPNNYLPLEWYAIPPSNHSSPLLCWADRSQDVTVMAMRTGANPSFDERFEGTGVSLVNWVMSLRYSGCEFRVLSHGWLNVILPYSLRQATGDSLLDGKSLSDRSSRKLYYEQKKTFKKQILIPMCPADPIPT